MSLKLLTLLLMLSVALFANDGGTDFVPRTVNFIIFAAILYYLIAEPVKNFFKSRSASIAAKLEEVQQKLKQAKEDKVKAEEELEKAKALAEKILETTKKEIEVMSKEIKEHAKNEIEVLEKSFEEHIEFERRKRIRAITQEILSELFEDKNLEIDKEKFVKLIAKKVA